MSNQERWDVVLKVISGPLSGIGEQTLRGPVVRIGVNPGPGGLALTGYRGLDERQAVITSYDGGSATVAPVGTNQVRLAPHPNVEWKEIDPITKPQYLNSGCAIHLGPVGRGCTLQFVKSQRLGVWSKGELASEGAAIATGQPAAGGGSAAIPATRVGAVRTSSVPVWFIGCLLLLGTGVATVLVGITIGVVLRGEHDPLGPDIPGPENFYAKEQPPAAVDEKELESLGLLKGLHQPFAAFVMAPNAQAAGRSELADKPELWDQKFYTRVAASVNQHIRFKSVFKAFDRFRKDYALVLRVMRSEKLPEVFTAIPVRESNYTAKAQSQVCAKGYWQFMPEVAWRLESKEGIDFKVRNCRFGGENSVYSPDQTPNQLTPPRGVLKNAPYMRDGSNGRRCGISSCDVDDRSDLAKSTAGAVFALREAFEDDAIAKSGSAIQITIATHNGGYDDGRFGVGKSTNLKPALLKWSKGKSPSDQVKFWGENVTCPIDATTERCAGSDVHRETQFYVDPIVTFHILAACYYSKNYAAVEPEFAKGQWALFNGKDGYCSQFNIPTPKDLGL